MRVGSGAVRAGAGEVAVTGVGLVTPGGIGADATWRSMCEGVGTAAADKDLTGLPVPFSCAVTDFDAEPLLGRRRTRRMDIITQMAVIAAREAADASGLGPDHWDPARVGVILGSSSSSFETITVGYERLLSDQVALIPPLGLPRSLTGTSAAEVAIDLKVTGPNFVTAAGCASGAVALGVARQLLLAGALDVVVSGGAETMRHRLAAACFAQMGALSRRNGEPAAACRPFDAGRDGFVLGEGAGILVLERAEFARARRAPVLAYLSGHGAACDAYHLVSPHPDGLGAEQALREALHEAAWDPADVDHVNAHGTGTVLNDAIEARYLSGVLPHRPPVTAPKSVLGHAGGAAAAIEAALAVLSLREQAIPPTANLDRLDDAMDLDVVTKAPRPAVLRTAMSVSAAFGGQNAALAFRAP
ncbi:beta-ketoacyl-[acyl-carrier-protein] synthase family protein [Streptomyces netropsis]|uniref:beta-ketoacyl-[acyl-carrier-protein] synthase family protein n=1 Tax=Streptomyces netropsis TaxID=55404 RepID=UPI00378EB4C2